MKTNEQIEKEIKNIEDAWNDSLFNLIGMGIIKSKLELKQAEVNFWKGCYRKLYKKSKEKKNENK